MAYLLALAFGPVQDFIATARRTRDLWFGSYMLSEISKACAKAMADTPNCTLIFPAPGEIQELEPDRPEGLSVANKIVVRLDADEKSARQIAATGEAAARERLRVMRDAAFAQVRGTFNRPVACDQVDDMLEVYWAAVPLEDYPQDRRRLEELLEACKATRDFKPVSWADTVPKSSLDGERESVIPEHEDGRPVYGRKGLGQAELYRRYRVRPGERLCGVGLLKRHGARRGQGEEAYDRFVSTSHVAAQPLLERLKAKDSQGLTALFKEYLTVLQAARIDQDAFREVPGDEYPGFGRLDGHLLFEDRLREYFDHREVPDTVKDALHELRTEAFGGRRPHPYYTLLLADGDRMGKTIDFQKSIEAHRQFSHDLARFSIAARQIVRQHQGWLVYAGGDDAMALVPSHAALECARSLADRFSNELKDYAFEDAEDGRNYAPTLSVGLLVSHHLEPLQDALLLARRALKTAKGQRNTVAVTVSPRSGVDRTVSGVWGTVDRRLLIFRSLHQMDAIPDRAGYDLEEVARVLEPINRDAARQEAVRILRRKKAKSGRAPIAGHHLEVLMRYMSDDLGVAEMAGDLIISRTFAEAAEVAGLRPQDPLGIR